MSRTKIVYVVGFTPDASNWHGDTARVGGFDWSSRWNAAASRLIRHLSDGETGHDFVLRSVHVPIELSHDEITDFLDGEGRSLWELPIPSEWIDINITKEPQ